MDELIKGIWASLEESYLECSNCSTIAPARDALQDGWLVPLFEGSVVNAYCPHCVDKSALVDCEVNPAFVEAVCL